MQKPDFDGVFNWRIHWLRCKLNCWRDLNAMTRDQLQAEVQAALSGLNTLIWEHSTMLDCYESESRMELAKLPHFAELQKAIVGHLALIRQHDAHEAQRQQDLYAAQRKTVERCFLLHQAQKEGES